MAIQFEILGGQQFPSRKPCGKCGTRKGGLRRACPYCLRPMCEECRNPWDHCCKGTAAARTKGEK